MMINSNSARHSQSQCLLKIDGSEQNAAVSEVLTPLEDHVRMVSNEVDEKDEMPPELPVKGESSKNVPVMPPTPRRVTIHDQGASTRVKNKMTTTPPLLSNQDVPSVRGK
eukprot:398021_1